MNQSLRKVTVLTLVALSLSTCAPALYAGDEPAPMTKVAQDQQDNNLKIAAQVAAGVAIVAALVVAAIAVKRHFKP